MGMLDQITGALGGQRGSNPLQGGHGALLQELISMLSQPGALNSLMSRFQQHGLGDVAQSWIGKGQNQPISASQVQQVLGESEVERLASHAGMEKSQAADAISKLLPEVIDRVTPEGHAPSQGSMGSLLSSLRSKLS